MVEENINELAIIFKRIKDEDSLDETFIPFKVVEGFYYEEEDVFIDEEQNVYCHIASSNEIGSAYGSRVTLYDMLKEDTHKSLDDIKNNLLELAKKYTYYKFYDEHNGQFGLVYMKEKDTEEEIVFVDKDTQDWYEFYNEHVYNYNDSSTTTALETVDDKEDDEEKKEKMVFNTPKELVDEIKKNIKGQDEAVETIVTVIWKWLYHPDLPKTNMLLIGPTGCGKTAIFEEIKRLLDIPMVVYGIPGTSQSGYKGRDLDECVVSLFYDSGCNPTKTEKGIIIIDEFDKLGNNRESGEVGTTAVQHELLKLIEGTSIPIEVNQLGGTTYIDTTNILFGASGAFTELFDEKTKNAIGFDNASPKNENAKIITLEKIIEKGGILRELIGRLPIAIQLNNLNEKKPILKDILLKASNSVFMAHVNDLKNNRGITIENWDEVIDILVDNAAANKIGARGLISPVVRMFDKIYYEIDNNPDKYEKIIIGKNIVEDNTDFVLVPKKVKARTRTKNEGNLTTK